MNQIDGIHGPQDLWPIQPAKVPKPLKPQPGESVSAPMDTVEISEMATFLSRAAELPDIRVEKVAEVRRAIEAGTYLTPEKLDVAIERMLEEL
jgi:negative regulator of flagellin synthesis FlgM